MTRPLMDAGLQGVDLANAGERAAQLEAIGFDGCFTFEGPTDPFFPLVAAGASSSLDLYTNVAIAFPRSPMHLAYAAIDLQRLSGGRFILGLGTQIKPHIERRFSAEWGSPVAHMRELMEAVNAIFDCWYDGTPLNYVGEYYSFTLMTPMFVPPNLPPRPPIWAGALGPRMTRMVAEVAGGVLIHPFNTEKFLREHTLPLVQEALAASGRTTDQFSFGIDAMVGVWRTEEERQTALNGCRGLLGFYGSTPAYKVTLDAHGWGDLQPELHRMVKEGRWGDLASIVDDEVLHTIAVLGTPTEVAAELDRRYGDFATRIGLQTPYTASDDLLAALVTAWKFHD